MLLMKVLHRKQILKAIKDCEAEINVGSIASSLTGSFYN